VGEQGGKLGKRDGMWVATLGYDECRAGGADRLREGARQAAGTRGVGRGSWAGTRGAHRPPGKGAAGPCDGAGPRAGRGKGGGKKPDRLPRLDRGRS
jgi:hypothetical protein